MEKTFNEALKDYVAGFGTGISVEKFVVQIYRFLMSVASSEMREQFAEQILNYLIETYGKRKIKVEVSEDKKSSAIVEE